MLEDFARQSRGLETEITTDRAVRVRDLRIHESDSRRLGSSA
jgi:hypothetical protein